MPEFAPRSLFCFAALPAFQRTVVLQAYPALRIPLQACLLAEPDEASILHHSVCGRRNVVGSGISAGQDC